MIVEKGYVSLIDVYDVIEQNFIFELCKINFEYLIDKLDEESRSRLQDQSIEDYLSGVPLHFVANEINIPNWIIRESNNLLKQLVFWELTQIPVYCFHDKKTLRTSPRIMDNISPYEASILFKYIHEIPDISRRIESYRNYLGAPRMIWDESIIMLYVNCSNWSVDLAGRRFLSGIIRQLYDPLRGQFQNIQNKVNAQLIDEYDHFSQALSKDIFEILGNDETDSYAQSNTILLDFENSELDLNDYHKPSPIEPFEGGLLCVEEVEIKKIKLNIDQRIQRGMESVHLIVNSLANSNDIGKGKPGRPATSARDAYYELFPRGKPNGQTWKQMCATLKEVKGLSITERSLQKYEKERISRNNSD